MSLGGDGESQGRSGGAEWIEGRVDGRMFRTLTLQKPSFMFLLCLINLKIDLFLII